MATTKTKIAKKDWGFEVHEEILDDKGKHVSTRQSGAAVCGPKQEDIDAAVKLMDLKL